MNAMFDTWFEFHASRDLGVTRDQYKAWCDNPTRQIHCVFCSRHGSEGDFTILLPNRRGGSYPFLACKPCGEYKGLEPCIHGIDECLMPG